MKSKLLITIILTSILSLKGYKTDILIDDPLLYPGSFTYIEGWLFFEAALSDKGIKAYNAESGDLEYEFIVSGRGPGEYLNFSIRKGPSNNTLEISDSANRKNDIYDVNCLKKKPPISETYKCILFSTKNHASRDAVILSKELVLNHSSTADGLLFLSKGDLKYARIDYVPEEIKATYRKQINQSFAMTGNIAINEERTHFAHFSDSFDRILFYKIANGTPSLIHEKKHTFLPAFDVDDFGSSSVMNPSKEYRGAYFSPIADNNYYYVLYSGKTIKDVKANEDVDWRYSSDTVQLFDFNGEEKGAIKLDQHVFKIALSDDKEHLFAVGFNSKTKTYPILKIDMN